MIRIFSRISSNFTRHAIIILVICTVFGVTSCKSNGSNAENDGTTELNMDSTIICDSITDPSGIKVVSSFMLAYPKSLKGSNADTVKLTRLLSNILFGVDDKDIVTTAKDYISEELQTYQSTGASESDEPLEDETVKISRFDINHRVDVSSVGHDLICLVKSTSTAKDRKASTANKMRYIIDLTTAKQVNLANIFEDSAITSINTLLKAQLLADNKCKDADQLAEMGFFNIDNLCINENFSISEDAITFFYNPLEIACYAVGEVSVAIPFEKIQEYIKKDSPICRLF